ncbi:hypothetical protein [Paraburkholderia sediminicola]|uniref:hypothetical protein n=1 Tax=Paraburkholderia sediminicola TaxID=458836 RepID=UPI0038BBED6A
MGDGVARDKALDDARHLAEHQPKRSVLPPVTLDGEARAFVSGFRDRTNWFMMNWLPRYRKTTDTIEEALSRDRPQDVFDIIWRTRDNSIANAGQGVMSYAVADRMRGELIQVIRDIHDHDSPDYFRSVVNRFEGWKEEHRIDAVPRLMIARAFAGVHPQHYHTTVHDEDQSRALEWFVDHTGFVKPSSTSWAVRAQALVAHLDRTNLFGGNDILERNMFPWFVVAQLRTRAARPNMRPGHTPRPDAAFAHLPESQRTIELRHNRVQTALFAQLAAQYGEENVWTECVTGTGGCADAVAQQSDGSYLLYEIKIADTAALVVRQAMGQLLEYGFRAGGLQPAKMFAVGEPALDSVTSEFIERLRTDFNLDIDYLQVELQSDIAASR